MTLVRCQVESPCLPAISQVQAEAVDLKQNLSFIAALQERRKPPVKLFIHEYSGHAFGVQLSRELARQGHQVVHAYSAAIESPRGAVHRRADDSPGFSILPVGVSGSLDKYNL